ncbi:MAG: hypothetical protein U5L00_05210 [Desulfovermiculus sp.]|nr:hypothetical protein [Desulfovermiculus sp.]
MRRAEHDFASLTQAAILEKENIKAGLSQQIFSYLLMHSLMQQNKHLKMGELLFWDEVKNIQGQLEGKNSIQLIITSDRVSRLSGLLFPPNQYAAGNKAVLNAPVPLLQIALDAVCRLANQMRRAKAELETEQVLARMSREMERLEKKMGELR